MKNLIQEELGAWKLMAHDHWKEHCPTMYRDLSLSGRLREELRYAANQTALEMDQLMEAGLNYHQAWEAVRQTYLLLPEEPREEPPEPPTPSELGYEIMKDLITLYQKIEEAKYDD